MAARYVLLVALIASLFAVGSAAAVRPACMDGRDNDGDGLIDLADPGCSAKNDRDESNVPPSALQPLGPSGTWNLVWRDEFNGDLSQWIIQGWGDQCTNSVSGGQLHQRMANAVEVNGCEIQSRFAASGDFVFEARMSYPATSDGHAAQHGGAWLHQQDGLGTFGEVDLFESDNCFIHTGTGANAAGVGRLGYAGSMNTYTAQYTAATDSVTVWWDGQLIGCSASNLGWDDTPSVFEFNQWVDTRCCPSVSNVSTDVEYARVWQR